MGPPGDKIESRSDGFQLTLNQEEVVLIVTDPARFARQLGVGQRGERNGPSEHSRARDSISRRLGDVDLEERFADVRLRISALATALTDESVPPSELFGRWLRLLKELKRHHGQGAMPTPALLPLEHRAPRTHPRPGGAAAGTSAPAERRLHPV